MTELSLVLANYNQAHLLAASFERIEALLGWLRPEPSFVLVDDASTDATWDVSQGIARDRRNVKLLRHPVNLGRGRSVADGIRAAESELVATLDTDFEVAPHYLLALLEAMRGGADIALARRNYPAPLAPGRGWELVRWLAHRGYRVLVASALGTRVDTASGCKVVRRSAVLPVLDRIRDERWFWDTELIVRSVRAGLRVVEIEAYCPGKPRGTTFALFPEIAAHFKYVVDLRRELAAEEAAPLTTPRGRVAEDR